MLEDIRCNESDLLDLGRTRPPESAGEGQLALVSVGELRSGPRHVKWLRDIELRPLGQ
jgi:hypothetical protein